MIGNRPPYGFDFADIAPSPLEERDWRVHSLALDLSGRCNLACRYCAESATLPVNRPSMTEEVLDRAMDLLKESPQPGAHKSIRLGSGEPMLAKSLIRRIDQRLRQDYPVGCNVPQVFITTNGTLLDRATRDWLVQTGWNVKISLDGPAAIHDRWRITPHGSPTYAKVASAAADLAERIPERFSVSAVLSRNNDPAEVLSAIAGLGVRRIDMVPVGHPDTAILPDAKDVLRYCDVAREYAERFAAGEENLPDLVRIINAARRVMGYDVKRIVCGAGRTFLGVGPDGRLYPCFRFIGIESFCLGNLFQGVSSRALKEFRQNAGGPYDRREDCRKCWASPLCGGPCFAEAALMGAGDGRPLALHCKYVKANAEAAIALVQETRRQDPERLLKLLDGLVKI
jgi:uncharacterized protein